MTRKVHLLIILQLLVFLPFFGLKALAFDWPSAAGLTQQVQAIEHEIANVKTLILNSKSKTPIAAASYLAVDLSDGKVLLKKNPDKTYPIASVTKLMNAVVVLENIDTAKTVTLTKKMLSPEGASPSLFAGLSVSVKDLLRASLTQSVNDAAQSLAEFLGQEKFLSLMNQKAKELGMTGTVYADVHGLDAKSRSTAADLAKLLAYIYKKHPEILAMTKINDFWLPNQQGVWLKFQNNNYFYNVSEFVGGKTGYSPDARQTFAAIFDLDKKPVAIVMLHSTNLEADTFKIIGKLKK